jgi:hypothetical protein
MQPFQILTRRERQAILAVACVVSLGVMAAALLPFVDDGNTPWFEASSELAIAAQRCDATTNTSRRHVCLREVAQAAAQQASSPTLLARH